MRPKPTPPANPTPAVTATKRWVERVVIGLSLCPWAKPVHLERSALRFSQSDADCAEELFAGLLHEMELIGSPQATHESTVLVAPHVHPDDFISFNDFVCDVDEYLRQEDLDEDFQVVGFHPNFCFAGEDPDDPANFVNRSPHPALHLLRQDDVTAAIDSHANSLQVPQVNERLLRSLGASKLHKLVRDCAPPAEDELTGEDDRPVCPHSA